MAHADAHADSPGRHCLGSLLAIGLHTLRLSRRIWLGLGLAGLVVGIGAAATIAGGTPISIPRWPWALPAAFWR